MKAHMEHSQMNPDAYGAEVSYDEESELDDEEGRESGAAGEGGKQADGKDEKKKDKKKKIYLEIAQVRSRNEYSAMIKLDKKN